MRDWISKRGQPEDSLPLAEVRPIIFRTFGHKQGPITRLMSPSDLGQILKPFVFLDLFAIDAPVSRAMGLHPHSGIATVTVVAEGEVLFDDPEAGAGVIGYGGVEWMRSGQGVWHGEELSIKVARLRAFQLWIALPPDLENGPVDSQYLEASAMPQCGPATIIVGYYAGLRSPVRCHDGVNYLMVTLRSGELWTYTPPLGHSVAWAALAKGSVKAGEPFEAGEMVAFEHGEGSIMFEATGPTDAIFVIGSAKPHLFPLEVGNHSVHSSSAALTRGERRIAELRSQALARETDSSASGNIAIIH